jgi:hypothetical protein
MNPCKEWIKRQRKNYVNVQTRTMEEKGMEIEMENAHDTATFGHRGLQGRY